METPNCKECTYNGKCACQHWNLDIKYCDFTKKEQYEEVENHLNQEEE